MSRTECPMCGAPVRVEGDTEGTSYYVHDEAEVERLREENATLRELLAVRDVPDAAVEGALAADRLARRLASDTPALPASLMCVKCGGEVSMRPNALCNACLSDMTAPMSERGSDD